MRNEKEMRIVRNGQSDENEGHLDSNRVFPRSIPRKNISLMHGAFFFAKAWWAFSSHNIPLCDTGQRGQQTGLSLNSWFLIS